MPPTRRQMPQMAMQPKSQYETPIVKILVGEEEALFNINVGPLEGTSFFAQHGAPRNQSAKTRALPKDEIDDAMPPPPANDNSMFFGDEIEYTRDGNGGGDHPIDLTDSDADYELKGKFYYSRDGFAIFARHLNDALPHVPTGQAECWALFKAYALAAQYEVVELQNQIIDALQGYYAQTTIPVTDIIYVISHWGDSVETHLAAYLVAQTAYEMALDYPKYRAENPEIERLLQSSNKVVLEQLLLSALQYATPSPTADPAKHKRNWRFSL